MMETAGWPGRGLWTSAASHWVRVRGTLTEAWVETCVKKSYSDKGEEMFVPEKIGDVRVQDGIVTIEAPSVEQASIKALEHDWSLVLRDHGHLIEPGSRYRTRRYCCMDRVESLRLARVDHTPEDKIRHDSMVEPVHVEPNSWALWSDGVITTAIGLPKIAQVRGLSESVARTISYCKGSDSPASADVYARLVKAGEITETVMWSRGRRGCYAGPQVLRLDLKNTGETLYVATAGYGDGYLYDVTEEFPLDFVNSYTI